MDKAQALHLFWSSFRVPAIAESSAYDTALMESLGIDFPYITYEVAEANFGDANHMLAGNLWYRGKSWKDVETKAKEICEFIGYGGRVFKIDGGFLRIMLPHNTIIYRRVDDPDDSIRRISITIAVDFVTAT